MFSKVTTYLSKRTPSIPENYTRLCITGGLGFNMYTYLDTFSPINSNKVDKFVITSVWMMVGWQIPYTCAALAIYNTIRPNMLELQYADEVKAENNAIEYFKVNPNEDVYKEKIGRTTYTIRK